MEERLFAAEKKIDILIDIIAEIKAENSMSNWLNHETRQIEFQKRKLEYKNQIITLISN